MEDRSKRDTYHEADVLDFPNAHVNALPLVHGETDVDEVVLVGHAANLHEGEEVAVVVTAFRLQCLAKGTEQQHSCQPWMEEHTLRGGAARKASMLGLLLLALRA